MNIKIKWKCLLHNVIIPLMIALIILVIGIISISYYTQYIYDHTESTNIDLSNKTYSSTSVCYVGTISVFSPTIIVGYLCIFIGMYMIYRMTKPCIVINGDKK